MSLPLQIPSGTHVALGGTFVLVGWVAFHAFRAYVSPLFSPLRVVPGPDNPHWFKGHFGSVIAEPNTGDTERRWMAEFGHIVAFKAFFNVRIYDIIIIIIINPVFIFLLLG